MEKKNCSFFMPRLPKCVFLTCVQRINKKFDKYFSKRLISTFVHYGTSVQTTSSQRKLTILEV